MLLILSPTFKSTGTLWPASFLEPAPTATTIPSIGFSFTEDQLHTIYNPVAKSAEESATEETINPLEKIEENPKEKVEESTPVEIITPINKIINTGNEELYSKLVKNNVSSKQNEKALTWWNNNKLSKYISLNTMFNIVNSDGFAQFIGNSITLFKGSNYSYVYPLWACFVFAVS